MLLEKEDLQNLNKNVIDLIFRGTFRLYKLKSGAGYILFLNNDKIYELDNLGNAVKKIDEINKDDIETQCYFKDSYEKPIILDIKF